MIGPASTAWYAAVWNRARSFPYGQAVVATDINYSHVNYTQSSLSYVGPDSSNRPVFFFAYANASNVLCATMFRIEDNGTITQGTEQVGTGNSCYRSVQTMSEYEGANSFGNGTGSYVYMAYVNSTTTNAYAQVFSINRDSMSGSFGTAVTLAGTPDFDGAVAAFVGGTSAVFGCRTGTDFKIRRYSRSILTLTAQGTISADLGYRIDPAQLGFNLSGTQYRSAFWDTGNGASGTVFGASELSGTNYSDYDATSITASTQNFGCNLNNTDKLLGGYYNSGTSTLKVAAMQVTWDLSGVPTFTLGGSQTVSYTPGTGTSWFPVSGFATDEAYVLYNNTTTGLSYLPITVSGTTTTLGTAVSVFTGLSNLDYSLAATSAKVGTKTYLAGIQPRTSGKPYIYGIRLS